MPHFNGVRCAVIKMKLSKTPAISFGKMAGVILKMRGVILQYCYFLSSTAFLTHFAPKPPQKKMIVVYLYR